jgi:tripartite-type tricarboxylate transporter receptor subunit TctC
MIRSRPRFRLTLAALLLGGLVGALACPARAQLPDRPIRIVLPSPPGGTADIVARVLAEAVAPQLRRGVVVDNKPGANGNIAVGEVARSAPDGSTLFFCAFGPCGANPSLYPPQGFDLQKDFAGLILVGSVQNVMTVRPTLQARTLQEVLALVKAQPGKVSFASSGVGASNHLGPEMLRGRFGLDWVHVPYRGSGPAMTDLMAGNVDIFFDNVPSILPHLRSGAVRPIAVLSLQRAPELPDVPTFAEAGVPGVVIESWFGLIAPAKTPPGTMTELNAAFGKALSEAGLRRRFAELGVVPLGGTPQAATDHMHAEIARWAEVIRQNGIRAE